jgi:aldehyde:ferredoxin oxidoreductase
VSEYEEMLREYYAARGWNAETGVPESETLRRLSLFPDLVGS